MNNCRRCGLNLEKKSDLRCKRCRERVNEEIDGQISRPREYYFKDYLKRRRK